MPLTWAGLLAAVTTAAGCDGTQSPLNPAGPQARDIATLTWWFFVISFVVYAVTMSALVWAMARRRRPSDDDPETSRRLARVIGSALAVTVVTLVGLSTYSVVNGRRLTPPAHAALTVDVVGHQWWWDFQYRDPPGAWVHAPNELHVPVGVPVRLRAVSADVIHSFWVPNLIGKRDLVPGIITHTWIQADRPGVYRGQCAEFCGDQHAHMALYVIAEPRDRFTDWLSRQRASAAEPVTATARHGRDVFLSGPCVVCHTIRGTGAGSRVGPDLTHVGSRATLAAGTLPNVTGHLAGWIADSQSIKPGNHMPPTRLSPGDLHAVVAYLETLQ